MSARKHVVFTTSAKVQPAASRTAPRLRRARSAWASRPSASSPVAGSTPIWPAQNTRLSTAIAWLYGPAAVGAALVLTARRVILVLPPLSAHDGRRLDERRACSRAVERPEAQLLANARGRLLGLVERRIERPQRRARPGEADRDAEEPRQGSAERPQPGREHVRGPREVV